MLLSAKYKMKPPMSARLMPGHPLAEGLVGFWPMFRKSSTQVFDLSGNGNDITYTSSLVWCAGKFGSALDFTGGNRGYTGITRSNRNISFVCWLKDIPASQGGIFGANRATPYYELLFAMNQSLRMTCWVGDGDAYDAISSTLTHVFTGWHQYAVTISDTYVTLYMDGVVVGGGASTKSKSITMVFPQDYYRDFLGIADHGNLYGRVLADSEIDQLYREPFCMFDWEWLPGRVAANGDVLVTPDPASAVAAKVDPTVSLGGITVSPSPASAVAASSGWIGISSAHLDSHCGDTGEDTLAGALDGTGFWAHVVTETHQIILNLGAIYYITNVRGRSNWNADPIDVNIYINDTGEAPWGDAVASGIDTWQDTVEWVEIEAIKEGQFVLVEIVDTEYVDDRIFFGDFGFPFTIFDVYTSFDPTVVIGSVTVSPNPASAVAATVAPTVEYGSVTIEPAEASAIAAAIDPTVNIDDLEMTPSPAYAIAAKVDPTVVLGSQTIEPTPAAAIVDAIGPYFADEGNAIFLGANF